MFYPAITANDSALRVLFAESCTDFPSPRHNENSANDFPKRGPHARQDPKFRLNDSVLCCRWKNCWQLGISRVGFRLLLLLVVTVQHLATNRRFHSFGSYFLRFRRQDLRATISRDQARYDVS